MRFVRSLFFAAMLLCPGAALAQTDGDVIAQLDTMFGTSDPFVEAFQAIQEAVEAGDSEVVAQWVAYPLRAVVDEEETEIADEESFVENYDAIVTEDIAATITNQRFADLFVNADGVMFGSGEMWLTLVCDDDACTDSGVRIIAIQGTE